MQTIFPIIRYRNARESLNWLCQAFGFVLIFSEPPEGEVIRHARLALGANLVMLGSVRLDEGMDTPVALGKSTQALYVHVPDVDAHYQQALASGAEIVAIPEDTFFGSRDYTAKDPEGHLWIFGSQLPEVPAS